MATVKGVMKKIEEREEIAALEAAAAQAAAEDAVEDLLEAADDYARYTNKLLAIIEDVMAPLNHIIHVDRTGVDLSAEEANALAEALDDMSEKHAWLFDAMNDAGVVTDDDDGDDDKDEPAPVRAKNMSAGESRIANSLMSMVIEEMAKSGAIGLHRANAANRVCR